MASKDLPSVSQVSALWWNPRIYLFSWLTFKSEKRPRNRERVHRCRFSKWCAKLGCRGWKVLWHYATWGQVATAQSSSQQQRANLHVPSCILPWQEFRFVMECWLSVDYEKALFLYRKTLVVNACLKKILCFFPRWITLNASQMGGKTNCSASGLLANLHRTVQKGENKINHIQIWYTRFMINIIFFFWWVDYTIATDSWN